MTFISEHHFTYVTDWKWDNFSPEEMSCRGTGKLFISTNVLDLLQELRSRLGRPLRVSSAYRSPEHNQKVSSTGSSGPHTTGRAVDILIHGGYAYSLIQVALDLGFTGIGVRQKGPLQNRFIHLDDLTLDDGIVRPTVWSY